MPKVYSLVPLTFFFFSLCGTWCGEEQINGLAPYLLYQPNLMPTWATYLPTHLPIYVGNPLAYQVTNLPTQQSYLST